jgi:uncharacterized membrane protein (Fun14 family)
LDSQSLHALLTQLLPPAGEFGIGGAVFFLFGYGLKKLLKLLSMVFALFSGLIGLGLWYANLQGWIHLTVDWVKIEAAISSATWLFNSMSQVLATLPRAAFFSGAAVGFLAGLKKG